MTTKAKSTALQLRPLPPHRFATLFPPMTASEFLELVADIKAKGQRVPITTVEEDGVTYTLEGIHREKACLQLGIAPTYTLYLGDDPLGYVVSANMVRRHLTGSQLGALAAEIATMRQGERTDLKPSATSQKVSRKAAAEMIGASERTTADAAKAKGQGDPALFQAVKVGDIPANVAADLTHAPKEEQREAVESMERDDKGKPTAAAKKELKAKATKAKSAAKKTRRPNTKMGKPKTIKPKKRTAAVYAKTVKDLTKACAGLFDWQRQPILEDAALPAEHRELVIGSLRVVIEKATALIAKIEAPAASKANGKAEPTPTSDGALHWQDADQPLSFTDGKERRAAHAGAGTGAYAVSPVTNVGKFVGYSLRHTPDKARGFEAADVLGVYPTMDKAKTAAERHHAKNSGKSEDGLTEEGRAAVGSLFSSIGGKPKTPTATKPKTPSTKSMGIAAFDDMVSRAVFGGTKTAKAKGKGKTKAGKR